MSVLRIENLSVELTIANRQFAAVRDVSFELAAGQTVGLAGESGCGKSMLALAIMGLLPPTASVSTGRILVDGQELTGMDAEQLRKIRGSRVAMIFQEPMSCLNPVMKIGDQIVEAITCHESVSRSAARRRAGELLATVRIPDATDRLDAYPSELSGGMRQRVMIALALSCNPSLLIADEPTTALDVTVQGQIMALLADLRRELDMAVLLITHDVELISQVADHLMVMYRGCIVESAATSRLLEQPRHPYTAGLLSCMPHLDSAAAGNDLPVIAGSLPALTEAIPGCAFHPRCSRAQGDCSAQTPALSSGEHRASCFYPIEARTEA